jgi:hypothetical protein
MVCSLGPTIEIARYISRLLQPIYDQVAFSTTFYKETDAVHAIEMYTNKGLLLPSTLFATLHINDLCSILSHEDMMQALKHFLNEYYKFNEYMQGISIDTIIKLIHIVLQNQIFVFQNKLYRQIKGGATNSPLTILLMNIYMFYWQEDLVKIMRDKNEIFGRCFDQVFLTWNGSKNELRSLLHATMNKNQSSSIQLTTSIGKNINYIAAQIGHINGKLQTKVNHDTDAKPRFLPYITDHPRLKYSKLIRASLIRAVLCCSDVVDFCNERWDIEETFRTNGYTWDYITDHVEEFFREFNVLKLKSRINQSKYEKLRHVIFKYDQEQTDLKLKQHKAEQDKEKWYISSTLKGETLIDLQENYPEARNVSIEIVGQPKYPTNTK